MKEKDYLVCIHCMTYNHASYIEDAMNGFCMQQTTFPFVAIVVDDASTDGEPEVIKNYLNAYFNMQNARKWETDDAYFIEAHHKENQNCWFAVVLLKYNFWQAKKGKEPLIEEWSNTKYVAICEGDDYWTAPSKLQKQIDFLENHQDYSMSFHSVNYVVDGHINRNSIRTDSDCDFTVEDMIVGGGEFCSTCSIVLKRNVFMKSYQFRKIAAVGDFPLQILCGLEGRIHYFSELMGSYRVSSSGSWTQKIHSNNELLLKYVRNELLWMQELNNETNFKYRDAIYFRNAVHCSHYINDNIVSQQEFLSYLKKVRCWKLNRRSRELFWDLVLMHRHPRIYRFIKKKDIPSLVYLLSPFLYNHYIDYRLNSYNKTK